MYKKILVPLDLSNDSNKVVDTAIHMAGNDANKLHLVHVVEPVAAAYSMDIYAVNINELQQKSDWKNWELKKVSAPIESIRYLEHLLRKSEAWLMR